jgi:glutamate dehydrogenase (NADP+)
MKNIHDDCFNHGKQADGSIDYKKGANLAGFNKIAKAMVNYGIL